MATTKIIQATVKNRTDTVTNWTQKNPVLTKGEIIVVQMNTGETRLKIGDGTKTFTQLPYTDEQIYNNVVTSVNGQTGDITTNSVEYTPQTLTDEQKKQARENVDAASDFVINATPNSSETATLDKTFEQIKEAIATGKNPIVVFRDSESSSFYLRMLNDTTNACIFGAIAQNRDSTLVFIVEILRYSTRYMSTPVLPLYADGTMPQISLHSAPTLDMEIATKKYVDDNKSGGTANAVLYTAQTLTAPQQLQARKNIGALPSEEPIIKGGAFTLDTPGAQIRAQLDGYLTSEAGEDFANIGFASTHPDATNDHIVISGLANFGDAEMVGLEDTAVSYAQLMDYTKPLMLTYDNNKVTGASYYEIRKAIERGRQIKLAVANTPDIIASNARNETNKSVLKFIHTDVGGDTVNITQYTVTAQASGLTVNVKSHEIA